MTTIIGLCGSLRRGSFNRMLLRAAAETAPPGTSVEEESIREIPLYDGDLEAEQGIPGAVQRLKDRIAGADGLLIVTPEYNYSIPGVLKNAIDWLSRPPADIPVVFGGRPVAIMGATTGPGGTALSQAAWLPVLRRLGMRPWFEGGVLISEAFMVFDPDGSIADAEIRQHVQSFIGGFAAFAGGHQRQVARRVSVALQSASQPVAY
jgi:chromate reductase, NAD(P)H dehydrogenase (quinone)